MRYQSVEHHLRYHYSTLLLCSFWQGTGCNSAGAARLSVARAQRQLAEEAGVFLQIRNFAVRVLHTYPHQRCSELRV